MFFTGIYRLVHNKSLLSDLRMQRLRLQEEIRAKSQYAANIADGIITPEEMASSSASIFGKQMTYMMKNVPTAMVQGKQAFGFYMTQYGPQMAMMKNDPSLGMMMNVNPAMLQMQFFKQALERQGKIEQEKLHAEEKELQKKLSGIDMQIAMLESETKGLKEEISASIQENAMHFGRGRG